MAARVVKSFPAILSIASRPFAPSRRKAAAVTPPPGKASSAARARRSGVVGLIGETVMLRRWRSAGVEGGVEGEAARHSSWRRPLIRIFSPTQ
jgi:hypothetical protein